MNRVLLVDDQPAYASSHREAFGEAADSVTSIADLQARMDRGDSWSAAFVDFDLSGGVGGEPTGLSAMMLLKERLPELRTIVYTTLGENGRTLFAFAAYHWLGARVVLDKSSGYAETLRQAADALAPNPTRPAWQDLLRNNSDLLDQLFAEPTWLEIWRVWSNVEGSIPAARKQLGRHHSTWKLQQFSTAAAQVCLNFEAEVFGKDNLGEGRKNSARATPTVKFAYGNSTFFQAVDLEPVLRLAQPWNRIRAK